MDDSISKDDLDRLTRAIEKNSSSLSNNNGGNGNSGRRPALDRLTNDLKRKNGSFNQNVSSAAQTVRDLTGSFQDAHHAIKSLAKEFIGGAIIAEILHEGHELTKSYQQVARYGQTFGGSLLKMSAAAGAAGMPLSQFADLVGKSGDVIGEVGIDRFTEMGQAVRKTAEKYGMYGMSLDQLNEYTTDYMKTQRVMGNLEHISIKRVTDDTNDLAVVTTAMAGATGVARDEILKLSRAAMETGTVMGRMMGMESGARMSATKKLMESTAILAAQQGAAGDFLSKLLNNTFGAGAAEFTEQGKALIEAGMGDLASGMNELSRGTMSQADTIKFLDRFKDEVAANSDTLRMLAVSGNAGAQTILEVAGNIKKMSIADLARAKDQAQTTDKMSKFFLNLESVWGNVVGAFQKGLLSGIEPIMRAVNGLIGDEGMGGLSAKAEEFGKSVGEMLTKIFTKENIEQAGVVLNMFWEVAKAAGQFMLNMINEITKFDGAIKTLSLGFFNLGTVVKILIGAMLLSKGLKMAGAVGGAIKTAHTLITGGEVAAGGIGALFTGRGAAAAAGTLVGGETAAAGGAGILGKLGVLGKFGKAIPILGGILGAVDAIDRFKKGDYLGAGISAAGGAASFIPGLGGIVGAAGSYAANTYLDSRKAEPTETTQRAQMDAATKSASDAASGAAQSGSDSDKDASTDDLNKLTQQQLAVSANTRDVLGNKLDNIARLLANMNT